MKGPVRMGVDREPQGIPKVQLQANEIQQARSLREIDQDIQVTVNMRLTPDTGAEDSRPGSPRTGVGLGALAPQGFGQPYSCLEDTILPRASNRLRQITNPYLRDLSPLRLSDAR